MIGSTNQQTIVPVVIRPLALHGDADLAAKRMHGTRRHTRYFVRSETGHVFGPVTAATLVAWAEAGRLLGAHDVSLDGRVWARAELMTDLGLEWIGVSKTGEPLGPMHPKAVTVLLRRGQLAPDEVLTHLWNGEQKLPGAFDATSDGQSKNPSRPRDRAVRSDIPNESPAPLEQRLALEAKIEALTYELSKTQDQLTQARAQIDTLHEALAWQDTAPLWSVRAGGGDLFGPVPLSGLVAWAEEGRLGPDHEVSRDGINWQPVAVLPAVQFDWDLLMPDGVWFGPMNAKALAVLAPKTPDAYTPQVRHRPTGQVVPLALLENACVRYLISAIGRLELDQIGETPVTG